MCSWFDVNMVAECGSTVLGSLSSESVADQRAKSSGTEDVTATEDAVEYVADRIGDAAEDVEERESHRRSRGKWSRRRCGGWQRSSEMVREPDYLKFMAEVDKDAVDPDRCLDMNDEDECGGLEKILEQKMMEKFWIPGSIGWS